MYTKFGIFFVLCLNFPRGSSAISHLLAERGFASKGRFPRTAVTEGLPLKLKVYL